MQLGIRYLPERHNPDKAVSLLDTAAARVAIGQAAVPPKIEDLRRRLEDLDRQLTALKREEAVDGGHFERIKEAEDRAFKTAE